ncbi:glycosyltransferase [Pseudobutyrivibrio ruminis]|uniref:glycosyltransferase n=1 Tax=Pseudobutyrivibrio ruminis TaxID=46206 RepID=UPI00068EB137|nr:glycosyltransferase [Pseudobutyrivibrio ruminis]
MQEPLVSIIIPVYNGTNYMREAIDSALAQTYENCEVIVVNDGSTDGGATAEVARSYGDRIRYFEKENGGVATAVNYGIEQMRGEYFAWLSHDDVFYDNKIELQMKAILDSGNEKAICHGNFDFLDMESNTTTHVNWLTVHDKLEMENSCFAPVFLAIHGSTVLLHRSHFERVGKYRTDLLATQDSEFLFRVMRGQKSVFVEEPLIIGRLHREQGQRTMACHKEEYNQMFKDFCEELTTEEKTDFCGSVLNFNYNLYTLLKTCKPADSILLYLKKLIVKERLNYKKNDAAISMWKELLGHTMPENSVVYIFGAGGYGNMMLEKLRAYGFEPAGFIDNDVAKQGTIISGLSCKALQEIDGAMDRNIVIIAMAQHIEEIREQLIEYGVQNILTYNEVNHYLFRLFPVNESIWEE